MGRVFRETFDQAYDGQHTGRFRPEELSKTELAHVGSLLEINIRRRFHNFIGDGEMMDFKICDLEVDCKYSKLPYGWMIPNETLGHYAMLCHANEHLSTFRIGFLRITPEVLNKGGNRDQKRTVSKLSRKFIDWAWFDQSYPKNTLLHLDPSIAEEIMAPTSGQQRINTLFRKVQNELIPRGVIYTVAQQKDPMKRIRSNGGSRSVLAAEGILILGDYRRHQQIARELSLPICRQGDSLAVRVFPAEPSFVGPAAMIDNILWRIARIDDPLAPAPTIA
ncbi:restriction endonuclease [Corynebacterium sanguinis]|uniref:Restriction endonuclease n=2 Tax=Corynebacterium sanguinis TaxID=2594913 RepID=A0A6C1TV22_9CORY|nr:restriction endonuclease [Corynebacterium sanguinis]TVS26877.1 restriction endonuclease [Corynebacterium sanguinis]